MKRKISGFSLIELVIVLFLTGAILGMVSALVRQTFSSLRFLQEKSQTVQSATLGLERLASEMREMTRPPTIGTNSVEFLKVLPGAPEAVGNDVNDVLFVSTWDRDYGSIGQQGTIRYARTANRNLQRRAPGLPVSDVATSVDSFVVDRDYVDGQSFNNSGNVNNAFRIRLSLQEQRRVVVFTTVVVCPGIGP